LLVAGLTTRLCTIEERGDTHESQHFCSVSDGIGGLDGGFCRDRLPLHATRRMAPASFSRS